MTTTINNEHKKLNVPNLRFPEFSGEWEVKSIKDVADFMGGGTPSSSNETFWQGTIPWISSSDIVENDIKNISITRFITEKAIAHSATKLCPAPSILIVSRVGVGKIALSEEAICTSQDFCNLINIKVEPIFLTYCLSRIMKRMSMEVQGTSIKGITTSEIQKISINIPSLQEQKKIGKILSLLDERIATQNKIIEELKKLKSALIEKVFCSPNQKNPMCRIEGFEQALSTYKMSDFSSRIATKNKDSKCSLVLTIAAQYGLVNQESFFNKSVASENLTGYYLLHKGEFAYNRSYSAGYDWGTVKRLDNYDEGVLSTLYICFKINETIVDSDYLAYYFESTKWHKGLSDIAGEGARNHGLLNVSITDYFNTKHRFPVIEEQKAIAKMLNTITEKERKATLLGECYQKQKQYLLRQMFI